MTILEAIGDYLVSNSHGTLGTNLFLGMMLDQPDVCTAVYEDAGGVPQFSLGTGGIQIDHPNIQIICRSARDDYPSARNEAESIRQLLASVAETTVSGIRIMRIQPTGSILPMGVDEKYRPMVSVNFRCMVAL